MIPKISTTSDPTGRVDLWPNQEQQLESVHSAEAFEMILSHLSLVLGERVVGPLDTIIQISKIKLGKLYAASIMYGYFLRRVDERYQLERSMNTLPEGFGEERRYATIRSKEAISLIEKQTQALFGQPDITVTEDGSLDASNDEVVSLTFSGLTMLVLEAVTFGSFLWDTENYVESKYPFINS
ncbi:UNVERIFIED_CONTAM: UV-B-induced protein, chloroplastic [Sesamum radiatum]|uniref:UV-B-induced protein, chloroplastic n=1 Tax=Sesamum radiatum TaxID=300843 RepID=A0AAW2MEJ4_SESRA